MTGELQQNVPEPEKSHLVLIVDDDKMTRTILARAISKGGFFVAESSSGQQGIEDFKNLLPDLILLDVIMPDLDGFQVCREIRRLPAGHQVPIIMVTGQEDYNSITTAFDAGATDFVPKPINPLLLCHRIRYILRANQTQAQLNLSEYKLATAQKIAQFCTWEWFPKTNQISMNADVRKVFDLEGSEHPQTIDDFLALIHPDNRQEAQKIIQRAVKEKTDFHFEHSLQNESKDKRILSHEVQLFLHENSGEIEKLLFTTQDITQKIIAEKKIKFLAYYDRLTELPNRLLFKEHLLKAIVAAQRNQTQLAVLFLDIDNFRMINDSFGRETGDELIKIIASRIQTCLRKCDLTAMVNNTDYDLTARFGADEFGVILENLSDVADAAIVARRLLECLKKVITVGDHDIYLSARIGLSVYPNDGDNVDHLMRNADAALSRAKELEKNSYQFFTADLNTKAFARFALESSLHKALKNNEFKLYYQPQVELTSGKTRGVEALIRWEHPDMGIISPTEFIPMAEEIGLIVNIGEWVMRTALTQARLWELSGFEGIRMAINLSAGQFRDPDLVNTIKTLAKETEITPKLLEFEITESMLMDDIEACIERLHELHALGCRLAIDDFGTGYSSLNYLKRLPVHCLKVDRSFVSDITVNQEDALIVKAIVTLAKSLNLEVVAEGVELSEHLSYLNYLGCDFIQGYYVSKPVPSNELIKFLGNWQLDTIKNQST